MADQTPTTASSVGPQERTLTISIKTADVEHPTILENVRLRTTVGELRTMIREQSPLHPTEHRQRLIFQGRPLLRSDATLAEALRENLIRDMDVVTIHMALRELPEAQPPNPPSTTGINTPSTSNPASSTTLPRTGDNPQVQVHIQTHQGQPGINRPRLAGPANPFPPMNVPPAVSQQQRQFMAQWANNVHREGLNRQAMARDQFQRAAMNSNNVQATQGGQPSIFQSGYTATPGSSTPAAGFSTIGTTPENQRGRSSPAPSPQPGMPGITRTIVREGVSPNGTRWRIVNQQPAPYGPLQGPPGNVGLSAQDVQNLLRNADATQASQAIANSMQRSTSNVSAQSGLQPPVGVSTPLMPGSRPLSRAATPDATRTPSYGSSVPNLGANAAGQPPVQPQVYLVQSPEGPRAILFNQTGAYFTPLVHAQPPSPNPMMLPLTRLSGIRAQAPVPTTTVANAEGPRQRRARRRNGNGDGAVAVAGRQRRRLRRVAHPRNPGGAALLAQAWSHLWLLLRLGLFVWWFTGPGTSWSRWWTIVLIAASIFIINTGLLSGVGEQVWGPVRRHFENMVPLQVPGAQGPQQANAGAGAAQGNQNNAARQDPNPADMATGLVEQRRVENTNWLADRIRAVERAGYLFLASLAPGIAEQHIRQLEERQHRLERERREAEAEAARTRDQEQTADAAGEGDGVENRNANQGGQIQPAPIHAQNETNTPPQMDQNPLPQVA